MNLPDDVAYVVAMNCPACGQEIQSTVRVVLHSGDHNHKIIQGEMRDYGGKAVGGRIQLHARPVAFRIEHSCGWDS